MSIQQQVEYWLELVGSSEARFGKGIRTSC